MSAPLQPNRSVEVRQSASPYLNTLNLWGHRLLLALTVLLSLCASSTTFAANQEPSIPPDISRITARKTLIVAMTSFDVPPFYKVVDGKMVGFDVMLAEKLADGLGVTITYDRAANTFNEVVDRVASGKADIAISKLSRTLYRANHVRFSEPYIRLRHGMLVNRLRMAQMARGREPQEIIRTFDADLAVMRNSAFVDFAAVRFPQAKVVQQDSWDEILANVVNGNLAATYRDELVIKLFIQEHPEAALLVRSVVLTDSMDAIAMAVAWNSEHLLSMANLVIDDLPVKLTVDLLLKSYRPEAAQSAKK